MRLLGTSHAVTSVIGPMQFLTVRAWSLTMQTKVHANERDSVQLLTVSMWSVTVRTSVEILLHLLTVAAKRHEPVPAPRRS